MKRMIVLIDETGEPQISYEGGAFTTMEMYGVASLLNQRATAEENVKAVMRVFDEDEKGDVDLALAEPD